MVKFLAERQEIVGMCRYLADYGFFAGTGGNIGVRLDDTLMAVTPSATDYYAMSASDVSILDIDTLKVVDSQKPPTVERGLHARMLKLHRSRRASVHTHQPIASAVALLHKRLDWPLGSDLAALGPYIALIPYKPSGTSMLAKAFEQALRPDIYVYLLASHGAICAVEELRAAPGMIRSLEAAAAAMLRDQIKTRTKMDRSLRTFVLNVLDKAEIKGA